MAKVGPFLSIIGGIFLAIKGFLQIFLILAIMAMVNGNGESLSSLGIDVTPIIVTFIMTLAWGILAIIGGDLGWKGRKSGVILCLIVGILAIVGQFITISAAQIISYQGTQNTIPAAPLSTSLYYFDPILVLLGGIIGVAQYKPPKKPRHKRHKHRSEVTKNLDEATK